MLGALLRQALQDLLNNSIFPRINALEEKIGNQTVREIVQAISTDAEGFIESLLADDTPDESEPEDPDTPKMTVDDLNSDGL